MKSLRYYQTEAHQALDKDINAKVPSMLLWMATGTGKTFTATDYLLKKNPKNVLWLTHKEELIDQSGFSLMLSLSPEDIHPALHKLFKQFDESFVKLLSNLDGDLTRRLQNTDTGSAAKWVNENMGLIKQTQNDFHKKYTIASIQTAARRLPELSRLHYDYVIIDEAHLALANSWMQVCNTVQHDVRIGLTATPERTDGVAMDNLFKKISYSYDLKTAIDDGNLCQIRAIRIKTNLSLDSVRTTAGELNQKDLRIVDCPERNNLICDEYLANAKGRKTMMFCVDIAHALHLTRVFQNRGVKADLVVSDETICPDRRKVIKSFTQGDTEVLMNVDILTTGFDFPNVGCIGLARPTKSKNLFIQIVGRGTRLKNDQYVEQFGQELLLLDFVDVSSRHALINTYSLDHGKRIEDRIFINKEEKEELIRKREIKEREASNRKVDRITDKNVQVDLLSLPEMDHKQMTAMEYADMTGPQASYLESLGYDIVNNTYTKRQAFEIIGFQPCSIKEMAELKQWGYDTSIHPTKFQYSKAQSDRLREIQKKFNKMKEAKTKQKVDEFNRQRQQETDDLPF